MSKHPEYTIITNPPPPSRARTHGNSIYPFSKMKVGQAFDVPANKRASVVARAYVTGFKITTAIQPNGNVRVWLTGKRPPRKPQARKGGKA